MDYDDSTATAASGVSASDPLPPEGWMPQNAAICAATVLDEQRPRLARFFGRRAGAQDVGDLVQECFRRLISSGAYPRVLAEQPAAYLFRTARNLLAERHRTDERRMAADHQSYEEPEISGPDPHAALEARDQMRRVAAALDRLKPQTRDIFLMHRFEGLSYEEIAAARGIGVKGVEKQIAKAMVAVRRARSARP
ncbi:MAG: RNA polymerase sigma factor [Sphingopyxis sp.]